MLHPLLEDFNNVGYTKEDIIQASQILHEIDSRKEQYAADGIYPTSEEVFTEIQTEKGFTAILAGATAVVGLVSTVSSLFGKDDEGSTAATQASTALEAERLRIAAEERQAKADAKAKAEAAAAQRKQNQSLAIGAGVMIMIVVVIILFKK